MNKNLSSNERHRVPVTGGAGMKRNYVHANDVAAGLIALQHTIGPRS